jgi:hypothetical protein
MAAQHFCRALRRRGIAPGLTIPRMAIEKTICVPQLFPLRRHDQSDHMKRELIHEKHADRSRGRLHPRQFRLPVRSQGASKVRGVRTPQADAPLVGGAE